MSHQSSHVCAVCGHALNLRGSAYLLSAQPTTNRIAILRWSSSLAKIEGVCAACTAEHALEIVAHWMVSGRLDFTFTQTTPDRDLQELSSPPETPTPRSLGREKPIGEIVINRDSVRDLLASDPEALASVLDSLLEALLFDKNVAPAKKPGPVHGAIRHTSVA